MNAQYPLAWFDDIIMTQLNVSRMNTITMDPSYCERIKERARMECLEIQHVFRNQVFGLSSLSEKELLVRQFHSASIGLYNFARYQNQPALVCMHLKSVNRHIYSTIEELILFTQDRFLEYLHEEDLAPQSSLFLLQQEIKERLPDIQKKLAISPSDSTLVEIVIGRLLRFSMSEVQPFKITFKNILYKKELLDKLTDLAANDTSEMDYSPLDKVLIYLNYNSKAYIKSLCFRIKGRVDQASSTADKIDHYWLSFKIFNQIHRKPSIGLNPNFQDITLVMCNWFAREIDYLEKKIQTSESPYKTATEVVTLLEEPEPVLKITCNLSTDQMALILRATDETRILQAKSMNEVFKNIVPYLSTPRQEEISYKAMRSKSYGAEQRDKTIAINALQKVIEKINEY